MNGRPKEVTVNLKDLTPSTSYTFEFTGESDAGEGQPKRESRNTPAPREYTAVLIVMELLQWDKILQLIFWRFFNEM